MTVKAATLLRKALGEATPKLHEIAKEAGITYRAIQHYRFGEREPSPEVLRAIITALRQQSAKVSKYADALEKSLKDAK